MEQLNQVQSAEFAELHDNLTELGTFNANLSKRGSCCGEVHSTLDVQSVDPCGLSRTAQWTGKALEPYFQQVVELEQAIGELERMVDGLDRASWQLGACQSYGGVPDFIARRFCQNSLTHHCDSADTRLRQL